MGTPTPLPPRFQHLQDLLFVTTNTAKAKLGEHPVTHENAVDHVESIVGRNRLFYIPDKPTDVYEASRPVIEYLQRRENASIKGVVILGNYEDIPSRSVNILSYDIENNSLDPPMKNPDADSDVWTVWNDDLYGDNNGDGLGELAVSRLPIVPRYGGLLGDENPPRPASAEPLGVRSLEFDFAEHIFDIIVGGDVEASEMRVSPPVVASGTLRGPDAVPLTPDDLATERIYLMLHGSNLEQFPFLGRGEDNQDVTALDFKVAGENWQSPGTAFAGVCWGALIARAAIATHVRTINPRDATTSLALALLDRGLNAVVGFTALLWVPPADIDDLYFGAPLQHLFWHNVVVEQMSPAEALFQARAAFIATAKERCTDPVSIAQDLKTFWSATCLGLGWQAKRSAQWSRPASTRMARLP
jgi:hypothetical protein